MSVGRRTDSFGCGSVGEEEAANSTVCKSQEPRLQVFRKGTDP